MLTDEEQAAMEATHKAEIEALNAKLAEAGGSTSKVEALEAKLKELENRPVGDGGQSDWARDEIRKISAQRDEAKKAAADAMTAADTAKTEAEAKQLAMRKEYAIKAAMDKAGVLGTMREFAMQKLDMDAMELDESGHLHATIDGEKKTAVDAVTALKETIPQFFGDADVSTLAASTSGGGSTESIKDANGKIDSKKVIDRGLAAFAAKL